jgi:cyclophilin family peptidyl-prolyl cis-trans isomerase
LRCRVKLLSSRARGRGRFVPEALMTKLTRRVALALPLLAAFPAWADDAVTNTIVIKLKDGDVVVRLRPDLAPKHVAQIQKLVARKFYDGVVFHRVIPGFMAQTGDPTGTGTGGSDLPNIPAEFSKAAFKRGTVGMARAQSPNSANSQFFICFADAPFLNGKYTVFGEVVKGMDNVDAITPGEPPANPDKMISVRFAPDT